MNDYVYEELIKRDYGRLGKLFPWISYTALTLFIIIFNVGSLVLLGNYIYFTGMISFGLWFLVFRLNRSFKVDYEVSITNDNFTVTKIINQKKRVEECNFSIRENCQYIGPVTSDDFKKYLIDCDSLINATSKSPYEDVDSNWCCFYNLGGVKTLLIFEFVPSMYKNFRRYNPRNVAKYTYPDDYVEETF